MFIPSYMFAFKFLNMRVLFLFEISLTLISISFAISDDDVNNIDWDILSSISKAYLCSGKKNWFTKFAETSSSTSYPTPSELQTKTFIAVNILLQCDTNPSDIFRALLLFRDGWRHTMAHYPKLKSCYRSGLKLLLMRYLCCDELRYPLILMAERLHQDPASGCNHPNTISIVSSEFCIISKYLSKQNIVYQIYVILYKLNVCIECDRSQFRHHLVGDTIEGFVGKKKKLKPSYIKLNQQQKRKRMKRLYDYYSWFSILQAFQGLQMAQVKLHDDRREKMEEVDGSYIRLHTFAGEGVLVCSWSRYN